MIVSNDFDADTCDALAEQLVGLTVQDADLTHREILMALIGAIGNTLASVSCSDCRENAANLSNQRCRTFSTAHSTMQPSTAVVSRRAAITFTNRPKTSPLNSQTQGDRQ